MTEADYPDQERSGDGVKRRSTFTPPAEDAEVPVNLGEGSTAPQPPQADAPPAPPLPAEPTPAAPTPASPTPDSQRPSGSHWDDSVLAPPERRSLSDQEIIASMGAGAAETGALINALQEQMSLRQREDEEFEGWEALIRQSFPEDEAQDIVLRGRAQFEGVSVENLSARYSAADTPPAAPQAPPEAPIIPEPDPRVGEVPVPAAEGLAGNVSPQEEAEAVESEPITLPRWGKATAEADEAPQVAEELQDEEPDAPQGEGEFASQPANPEGSFEQILVDPDAVTPPTNSWPLVETSSDSDPGEQYAESTPPSEPPRAEPMGESEGQETEPESGTDWLEATMQSAPEAAPSEDPRSTAHHADEPVVSVKEALATKPVNEIALAGLSAQAPARFGFDHVGAEPTADNVRTDKATQLLWVWWALGTPLPVVLLGVWLIDTGLSVGQAVIAAGAGALLAAIPLVLGTLKGAQSGLPTLVSSRAAFGLVR